MDGMFLRNMLSPLLCSSKDSEGQQELSNRCFFPLPHCSGPAVTVAAVRDVSVHDLFLNMPSSDLARAYGREALGLQVK